MLSCQLYLQSMLQQVKAIRDLGVCNMLDRKGVQFWAYYLQFYEAVDWIQSAPSSLYHRMLTETAWDEVDSIVSEELKGKAANLAI